MEEFVRLKNDGLENLNHEKYNDAIKNFSEVIERAPTDTDEQTELKCVCLANRSMCHMANKELQKAFDDANAIIDLYKEKRPESEADVVQKDVLKNDPLIAVLAAAYLRRGQVFELNHKLLDALQEYSISGALKVDEQSQNALKHVLSSVGIPEIEQTDEELRPFGVLLLHFLNEMELMAAITQLIDFLKETKLSEENIKKFNDTGASRILIGIMQLYMEREPIVVGCLVAARFCAEKGIQDVFNGFMVVRIVMDHWKQNKNIIGDSLSLMCLAPQALYPYMSKFDFIPIIISSFELELTNDEYDAAFYLLFSIGRTQPQLTQIVADGILDEIFSKRSDSAFILLSKLLAVPQVADRAKTENTLEWALKKINEMISEEPNAPQSITLLVAGLLTVASLFSFTTMELPEEKYVEIFTPIWKAIMKHSKDRSIVSNGFATLAIILPHIKPQVIENKSIRAASAILAIHTEEEIVAQNIVAFLFNCANDGLLSQVLETRAALPTVMKVLIAYPKSLSIVERAVGLAILCNHPNKEKLLEAGLLEFPESQLLLQFLAKMAESKPSNEAPAQEGEK